MCKAKELDIDYIAKTLPQLGADAPDLGVVPPGASTEVIRKALDPLDRRLVKKLSIFVEKAEEAAHPEDFH